MPLNIPILLTWLRVAMIPLIVGVFYLPMPEPMRNLIATVMFIVFAATDWLDGFLARRWHQTSRVGQMLDPVADRLYIGSTLVALAIRDIIPWWLVVLLVARDLLMVALVPLLRTRGATSLPVHLIGKAATFCLLYAFPMVLLGDGSGGFAQLARILGWAFAIWGTALYWWAGLLYVRQTIHLLQQEPAR